MNNSIASLMHTRYVTLAIKTLNLSTSRVITEWVHNKIKSDIEAKYRSPEYELYSDQELDELKQKELEALPLSRVESELYYVNYEPKGLF